MSNCDWFVAIVGFIIWTIVVHVCSERYMAICVSAFTGYIFYWVGYWQKSYNIEKENR